MKFHFHKHNRPKNKSERQLGIHKVTNFINPSMWQTQTQTLHSAICTSTIWATPSMATSSGSMVAMTYRAIPANFFYSTVLIKRDLCRLHGPPLVFVTSVVFSLRNFPSVKLSRRQQTEARLAQGNKSLFSFNPLLLLMLKINVWHCILYNLMLLIRVQDVVSTYFWKFCFRI